MTAEVYTPGTTTAFSTSTGRLTMPGNPMLEPAAMERILQLIADLNGNINVTKITPEGGIAVNCGNDTGGTSVAGTLVVPSKLIRVAGDLDVPQTSAWSFAGVTPATCTHNTGNAFPVIYWDIKVVGSDNVVACYYDSARAHKICAGTDTAKAGGPITLSEESGSGVTGSVTLIASAVATSGSPYLYYGYGTSVQTAAANQEGTYGVVYTAGIANQTLTGMWVVVAGVADVLLDSSGAMAGGWLYAGTTAGAATCAGGYDSTKSGKGLGYARTCASAGAATVRATLALETPHRT